VESVKYSIIVATYNRLEELQELLASAESLTFPKTSYEIVIVDDGSDDGTEKFITDYISDISLLYLKQANQGPGEARNHGMRKAHGRYFMFVDSDCTFPPEYLDEVDKAVRQHGYEAFGGPDTYHPDFSDFLKAINYTMTSFLGSGGTRGSSTSVTKYYPRSFNMGIHRKIFDDIGGMNRLRHGQDMDLSMRIYAAGYKVGLIPDAYVYHKRRTSLKRFYKQIFNWGVARINLGRTYPEFMKLIAFMPFILLSFFVLSLVGALFSGAFAQMLLWSLLFASIICLIALVQATSTYKSLKIGLLAAFLLPFQVLAYACGTASGLLQWMMGKEEAEGFGRNYYK